MHHHTLQDVLSRKSAVVAVMDANDTLEEAVARMNRLEIGAMIVLSGDGFVGVLSDRDVLKWLTSSKRLDEILLIDALPSETVVAQIDTTVRDAIALMERSKRRHLPVLAGGRPVGIVSLGDLLHFVANELEGFVTDLVSYIHGPNATVEMYVSHGVNHG